ncbi:MAG TPA: hypothetical protein VN980_09755 [Alphaproteobacteria bacterium]|nr:hypothetical protein [Alphaproteobacteria bacterium]
MERRHAIGLIGLAGLVLWSVPAAAANDPVAMVEDVKSKSAGVQFMEYLTRGKVIALGPKDVLVVDYFHSCVRETITGGTVTVGAERSDVIGGDVSFETVQCDGGQLRLTTQQASQSGVVVYRALPKPGEKPTEANAVERTLYGLSPLIDLHAKSGKLVVERLDKTGERIELNLAASDLLRGSFYDFARHGRKLAAGGVYRASANGRSVVFKIDPSAQPGEADLAGRLLQL